MGVPDKPARELQVLAKMKAGEYYDEGKIKGDMSRIKDYFGYRGHRVSATATPVYSPNQPGIVMVTYEVKEK